MLGKSNTTRRFTRKRLLTAAGFVATLLAVLSLVTGITFARMSANTSAHAQANTFATGTVSLNGATTSGTCAYGTPSTLIYPGDSLSACTVSATYANSTTNVSAYIGLDVLIVTNPGGASGETSPLYTGNSTDLTLTISDGTNSGYTIPTTSFTGSGTGPGGQSCTTLSGSATATCYQVIDELAAHGSSISFSPNTPANFTLTPTFSSTTDATEGASAVVTLTAHAVQFGNNALPIACQTSGNPNIGKSCPTLKWS